MYSPLVVFEDAERRYSDRKKWLKKNSKNLKSIRINLIKYLLMLLLFEKFVWLFPQFLV
jgi:hypothetical protein